MSWMSAFSLPSKKLRMWSRAQIRSARSGHDHPRMISSPRISGSCAVGQDCPLTRGLEIVTVRGPQRPERVGGMTSCEGAAMPLNRMRRSIS